MKLVAKILEWLNVYSENARLKKVLNDDYALYLKARIEVHELRDTITKYERDSRRQQHKINYLSQQLKYYIYNWDDGDRARETLGVPYE